MKISIFAMEKEIYAKLLYNYYCTILLGAIENVKIESNSSIEMLVKFFCHDYSQTSLDGYQNYYLLDS